MSMTEIPTATPKSEVPTLANQEGRIDITEDLVFKTLVERAEKEGYKFESDTQALEWAKRRFETLYQRQLKHGTSVRCSRCGKHACNATTGPFLKTGDTYTHKGCI